MREEEKIFSGVLFSPSDPELKEIKLKTHNLNLDYNRRYEEQKEERDAILRQMLGKVGTGVFIQGPVTFHYGTHTRIGDHCFINFNFTVQDDAEVVIGNPCRVIREITEKDSIRYTFRGGENDE